MRMMLLSFKPDVYNRIKTGDKIFEHRRVFPDEPNKAYMYVSYPICVITEIIYLNKRHRLCDWKKQFASDDAAIERIEKYMKTANYAMEIIEFQETTEISLEQLREDIEGFVCTQMYYYLDEKPLLSYIEEHLVNKEINIKNTFDVISSEMICRH